MAFISHALTRLPASATFSLSSSSSSSPPCPFTRSTHTGISNSKPKLPVPISCSGDKSGPEPKFDRRDLLVGLGGLYGATAAMTPGRIALADPVTPPDLTKCQQAKLSQGAKPPTNCCPPFVGEAVEFKPDLSLPLRVRPAAHAVTPEYVTKFNKAIEKMKRLPCSDPRNFMEQSKVHCAYCSGFYTQENKEPLQIHFSWLFFPWHRCYLYFFERILGDLLDDDSFAMPFWNWDYPAGMRIPRMYADPHSALYDKLRDSTHYRPDVLVDLNFGDQDDQPVLPPDQRIADNLATMHRQVISNGTTASLFLGGTYRAGDKKPPLSNSGSIELIPHNTVHSWTGDPNQPNNENMGKFYSAARDPIFYAHHSNIDRLWNVWKGMDGHQDFADLDWLEAAFYFYDEKAQLVKIRVRDCLDSAAQMRYTYENVPNLWINTPPTVSAATVQRRHLKAAAPKPTLTEFPVMLNSPVTALVKRPTEGEKKTEEALVIDEIEVEENVFAKFDVFVNAPEHEQIGPGGRELAGSFVALPHDHKMKSQVRFGLNHLLKDLKAEDDESILVTLVPRAGKGKVKVGGAHIEHID